MVQPRRISVPAFRAHVVRESMLRAGSTSPFVVALPAIEMGVANVILIPRFHIISDRSLLLVSLPSSFYYNQQSTGFTSLVFSQMLPLRAAGRDVQRFTPLVFSQMLPRNERKRTGLVTRSFTPLVFSRMLPHVPDFLANRWMFHFPRL
jgi:hypothetical protein